MIMTTPTKVTREHLGMRIAAADYVVMPDGRTTVCQLTMQNGFTVRGESSCVSVENFNKELGEKYAYEKAFDAAWAFEGRRPSCPGRLERKGYVALLHQARERHVQRVRHATVHRDEDC